MRHLDTNIAIAHLNGNPKVEHVFLSHLPNIAISSVVLAELLYGARASTKVTENMRRLENFLQMVKIVDFDKSCADTFSYLRLELRKKGKPTNPLDLLIGAVAVVNNAILVTNNTKHFENIDNLILEDWLKP